MRRVMNYYLIGFPCCGKTTVGRELSRLTGLAFFDLDEHIERSQGLSIGELMARLGQERFRQLECAALRLLAQRGGTIVACGGGTPCQPGMMQLMNATGITVWLTTSEQRLIARLCLPEHRSKRPLISALSDDQIAAWVHTTIMQRAPHYAHAQLQFDATDIETAAETTATTRRLAQTLHLL